MYIVLAIVATLCTIVASHIRDAEGVPSKGAIWIVRVLIGVATVSAGQIVTALFGELIGQTVSGNLWQVVLHIPCIVSLYMLLIVWYHRSIRPRSQYAG